MESILLGVVLIVCIYILYCICTAAKEPFIGSMSQNEEERLGALATTINSPTNTDRAGNNPTGFIASIANILTAATTTNIQNTYNTALGNPNTGPRIDDNTSLLYMIDFCYHGAKVSNPFSDPAFVTNCGICMTTGTTVDGRASTGSNLGVVVYPEDKAYSLSQGIDAVPSARTATCAPLIKTSDAGSNVTSLAINAQQYAATRAYTQSNNYAITSGIGSGRQTVSCPGTTSTGHPNVIKDGGYRYGAWDTRIGSQVDYNRVNQMTTTPFDPSCIEQPSCTFTTSSLQWDAYTLCGNPNPTPVTGLKVTAITATGMTFTWDASSGKYGDTFDYKISPAGSMGIKDTNSVVYDNLNPETTYTFTLTVRNSVGNSPTVSIQGTTQDDRVPMSDVTFSAVTTTGFTVKWSGCDNATGITLKLDGPGNPGSQQVTPPTNSYTYTGLQPGSTYTFSASCTYQTTGVLTTAGYTQKTVEPSRIPMSGVTFSGVTTTGFTVTWAGCDNATGITLNLAGPGNPSTQQVTPPTNTFTYTGLQAGSSYTFSATCTYPYGNPLTSSSYTQSTSSPAPPPPSLTGVQPSGVTTGTNSTGARIITFNTITNPTPAFYGFVFSSTLTATPIQWGVNIFPVTKAVNMKDIGGGKILNWISSPMTTGYVAPIAIYTNSPDSFDVMGYVSQITVPASSFYPLNSAYLSGGDPIGANQAAAPSPSPSPPSIGPSSRDLPTNVTAKYSRNPDNSYIEISFKKPTNPTYDIISYLFVPCRAGYLKPDGTSELIPLDKIEYNQLTNLIPNADCPSGGTGSQCTFRGYAPGMSHIIINVIALASDKHGAPFIFTDYIPISGTVAAPSPSPSPSPSPVPKLQEFPGEQATNVTFEFIEGDGVNGWLPMKVSWKKTSSTPVGYAIYSSVSPVDSDTITGYTLAGLGQSDVQVDPNDSTKLYYFNEDSFLAPPGHKYAALFVIYDWAQMASRSIPASRYLLIQPISLGSTAPSPPGAQPTGVRAVQMYQNLYKNNFGLQYGNVKISWKPPAGVVQYALVNDAHPRESGKNTIKVSTVKMFTPSDTLVDPNYPDQVYYIAQNFNYPDTTFYAGIVALYDNNPKEKQRISIPASFYVPVNAHDKGPAYSGPPIKAFKSCTGENTENDEIQRIGGGGFNPEQYFFTRNFNHNIGYVYVPGGLTAEVTDLDGKTRSIQGGSDYYGKGESLCNSSGDKKQTMVLSVKNTGAPVNPQSGTPPSQSFSAAGLVAYKAGVEKAAADKIAADKAAAEKAVADKAAALQALDDSEKAAAANSPWGVSAPLNPTVGAIKLYSTLIGTFINGGRSCTDGKMCSDKGWDYGGVGWGGVGISYSRDFNNNPVDWSVMQKDFTVSNTVGTLFFINTKTRKLACVSNFTKFMRNRNYENAQDNAMQFSFTSVNPVDAGELTLDNNINNTDYIYSIYYYSNAKILANQFMQAITPIASGPAGTPIVSTSIPNFPMLTNIIAEFYNYSPLISIIQMSWTPPDLSLYSGMQIAEFQVNTTDQKLPDSCSSGKLIANNGELKVQYDSAAYSFYTKITSSQVASTYIKISIVYVINPGNYMFSCTFYKPITVMTNAPQTLIDSMCKKAADDCVSKYRGRIIDNNYNRIWGLSVNSQEVQQNLMKCFRGTQDDLCPVGGCTCPKAYLTNGPMVTMDYPPFAKASIPIWASPLDVAIYLNQ